MKNKLATFLLSAALIIPGIIASTSNSADAKRTQQQTQEVVPILNKANNPSRNSSVKIRSHRVYDQAYSYIPDGKAGVSTEKLDKKGEQSNYLMKLAQKSKQNSQVWNITRRNSTYQIKIQQHNSNFTGSYSNINNDSIFTGKLLTGRGNTLIHFVQEDDNGYYAIHSGIMINNNLFRGEWYDSSGNSGTFKLQR